jgi:hypothetical protein
MWVAELKLGGYTVGDATLPAYWVAILFVLFVEPDF